MMFWKESNLPDTLPGAVDDPDDKPNLHSFIVRVWLERSGTESDEKIWRGQIIHLPGDERHYFSDIHEIPVFIESYLKKQE